MAAAAPSKQPFVDTETGRIDSAWLNWLLDVTNRSINGVAWDANWQLALPGFTGESGMSAPSAPDSTPVIDPKTGLIHPVWLKWLLGLSGRTINGAGWGIGSDLTLTGTGDGAAAGGSGGQTTIFVEVAVEQVNPGSASRDYDVVVWEGNVLTPANIHVSSGTAELDGATYKSLGTYTPPHTLEFEASFSSSGAFEHIGFASDLVNAPWVIISNWDVSAHPGDGGGPGIWARSFPSGAGAETHTLIADATAYDANHSFKIEWGASAINYYVDSVLKATHSLTIGTAMYIFASDFSRNGTKLVMRNVKLDGTPILV